MLKEVEASHCADCVFKYFCYLKTLVSAISPFSFSVLAQTARWKVTSKEALQRIGEYSEAAITIRGTYFPPGKEPKEGERKIYLAIESMCQGIYISIFLSRMPIFHVPLMSNTVH